MLALLAAALASATAVGGSRECGGGATLVFLIGHNKQGSRSICQLVNDAFGPGACLHNHNAHNASIAAALRRNVAAQRAPLHGLDLAGARLLADMEHVAPDPRAWVPVGPDECVFAYRDYFRTLADAYPAAKFVLNLRDEDQWVRSRLTGKKWSRGGNTGADYSRRWCRCNGVAFADAEAAMRHDHRRHRDAVKEFFAFAPDRLLVFDVDADPADALRAFVGAPLTGEPLPRAGASVCSLVLHIKERVIDVEMNDLEDVPGFRTVAAKLADEFAGYDIFVAGCGDKKCTADVLFERLLARAGECKTAQGAASESAG